MENSGDPENDRPGADLADRSGRGELHEVCMLTVKETTPPKEADKKPATREFSRAEKKSHGFLDVFLEVAERKKEDEADDLHVDRISGTRYRGGSD